MLSYPRTLLVDDDETTNFLNQLLLQRVGFTETLTALNGQEALELLRATGSPPADAARRPTLILLDMKMPIMNGIEFLEAYAQCPPAENPALVIIMLTTSVNPNDLKQMQTLPIAGYLNKPLTTEKITRLLQDHFGHPAPAH